MRSAVYQGNRTFTVQDAEPIPPGEGEVTLAVAYTGICGTDLHILHGAMDHRVGIPAVIGHEMSGSIACVGPGVEGWAVGDPVTVMPLAWCGQCPACRAGNSHICHRLKFVGIDSPGAMQNRWTVPANLLVRLPVDLPLRFGALVEPTAVAVHDVRRSGLRAGEHAVVVGGGPVGLLIACVSRMVGADVTVVEVDPYRREVAADLGFDVVNPSTEDVVTAVEARTGGAGAAVAFEVSGSVAGVQTATEVLATRGRLVVVAIHSVPRAVDLHRVFWRELTVLGVRVYQRDDFEEAVRLVAGGEVPVDRLVERVVPLADVAEAFRLLEHGGVVKVLIDCGDQA